MTTNIRLAPQVTLRAMQTDKFKTGCFSINFVRPHCAETAAEDALLPSVLLRATERYPDISSISAQLDELYGATFGTLVRRKGEIKLTGFYADFIEDDFLPDGDEVFAPMVDFAREVLFRPFTENGCFCVRFVEGEKQNLINAIESSLNDKRTYATTRLLREMCADEAYGVPRLGTVPAVRRITAQSLWAHYQTVLATSRVEIFYAGRHSPEDAAAVFSRLFAGRTAVEAVPVGTAVVRAALHTPHEVEETLDVLQGKLVLGLRTGITGSDEDYPALSLLNAVLGAGMTSKLFVNVREKRSLCYYASSSIEKYKGIMLISSGISAERRAEAQTAILAELDACRRGEITETELESARRQLLSALRASMDAPAQLDDFYLGLALCGGEDIPALMEKVTALTVPELAAAAQKLSLDTVYFLKRAEQ